MKKEEIFKCYCIPEEVFNKYYHLKIIDKDNDFSEDDIKKVGLAMSLEKLGFDLATICTYLDLSKDKEKNKNRMLKILSIQRSKVLDEMHKEENNLDELDYMIFDLRN